MWASTKAVSLQGAVGHVIDVQVDVSQGQIATNLVGRADASINEARDRCRAAIENSDYHWPTSKRITILLSPADLPKRGPHFDLAIAVAVLAAGEVQFPDRALDGVVLIGELTLDGRLRCVPGVLPMVMSASARGIRRVVVPEPQISEAALVPGVEAYGARSLRQVVALLLGEEEIPEAPPVDPPTGQLLLSWRGEARLEDVDLADVLGLEDARFALEVAAVGGHHMLLTGPKGAGKTTLAERLPTILPDLGPDEALELTDPLAVRSPAARDPGADPAAVPRAAPLGVAGRHPGRRQRPGPAGRGQQGAPRSAVPRRVPPPAQRRRRGAAPAAGERRDHHRPRRRGRDLPCRRHARPRRQPVSVRGVPPVPARQPLQLR
jgi:magnesium chelatase family protein